MQHHVSNANKIAERLDSEGYKMTRARREIVDWVAGQHERFTANEIVESLVQTGVGRATVFRTLDLLVQLGYLNRIHSPTDCATYTLCDGGHHHHLVCTSCSRVIPISAPAIEAKLRGIARREQFRVSNHHLEVFGQCAACQGSSQTRNAEVVRA